MSTAIQLKAICKDFPLDEGNTVRVLHEVSAHINYGQLTMLVGPSGCGKTTLISVLSGILSASSGEVDILGQKLFALSDRNKVLFRRQHIGFIFQQYNLLPALTAAENAAMPLLAAGMPMAQATARAKEVLSNIGMSAEVNKYPRQLSGGQQQRVAIARALVHKPELIICDEPTAALDAKTGQSVMQILRSIANEPQRAVLVVTHDSRIYHFADRIIAMSDGHIVGDYKPADYREGEGA